MVKSLHKYRKTTIYYTNRWLNYVKLSAVKIINGYFYSNELTLFIS